MAEQIDLYEQHDPDPPAPAPVDVETAQAEEPKKRGRPRTRTPEEAADAKRESDRRRRAKAKGPPTPAPDVAAAGSQKSPAETVALTMADMTEEQRKAREVALSFLGAAWSDATRRLLGVSLVVPEGADARREFEALIAVRPDIGAASAAWQGWVTAFDAVAVKRGWYRAVSAETALVLATVGLAGTVGAVYYANVRADRQRAAQAKADARAEADARAAETARESTAEHAEPSPTA